MNLIIYILCSIILILFIISLIIINTNECIDSFTNNNNSLETFLKQNNSEDLLDLPLSEFYVSTSHNSYLDSWQVLGNTSTNNLLKTLNNGARCIELDIHMAKNVLSTDIINMSFSKLFNSTSPVVTHSAGDKNIYPLSNYLKIIKENAFANTNDPLFIYLEIFDMNNERYVKSIANNIKSNLGSLLYEGNMELNFTLEGLIKQKEELENNINMLKQSKSMIIEVKSTEQIIKDFDTKIKDLENNKIEKEKNILNFIQNNFGKTERNIDSKYFINVPIKKLLNKICIIINYFNMNIGKSLEYRNKYLFPLVHGTSDEPGKLEELNTGWFDRYPKSNILFGNSNTDSIKRIENTVGRVYPYNILKSSNFNINPFINSNYTFIAVNYGNDNNDLKEYKTFFKYSQLVPKNYIISNNSTLIKPVKLYTNNYREYQNSTALYPILKTGNVYSSDFSWINNNYIMTMQNDGNLVIYKTFPNKPRQAIWSTKTGKNTGASLWCQYDGNMVIYGKDGKVLWSSGTYEKTDKNSYCMLTSDGDFILYNEDGSKRKTLN